MIDRESDDFIRSISMFFGNYELKPVEISWFLKKLKNWLANIKIYVIRNLYP
jgi:hypothetical protein